MDKLKCLYNFLGDFFKPYKYLSNLQTSMSYWVSLNSSVRSCRFFHLNYREEMLSSHPYSLNACLGHQSLHGHPKILNLSRTIGSLVHTSYATFLSNESHGDLMIRYPAMSADSSQKPFNNPTFNKRHIFLSVRDLFILAANRFVVVSYELKKILYYHVLHITSWNLNQCTKSHYMIINTCFSSCLILYLYFPQLEFGNDIIFILQEIPLNLARKITCER